MIITFPSPVVNLETVVGDRASLPVPQLEAMITCRKTCNHEPLLQETDEWLGQYYYGGSAAAIYVDFPDILCRPSYRDKRLDIYQHTPGGALLPVTATAASIRELVVGNG